MIQDDEVNVTNEEVTPKRYTVEDILTMMGGTQYFMEEQVMFIYHKLNGDKDEAQYYLNLCLDTAKKLEEKAAQMKTSEEIKALEEKLSEIKENEINETEMKFKDLNLKN